MSATVEKTYPIYKFHARWNQDDFEGNSNGSNIMYRDEPSPLQLARDLTKWWRQILTRKGMGSDKTPLVEKNPKLLELGIEFYEYESWCISWFNHYTFNIELTDEEIKRSFHAFVQRKLPDHNREKYCLMGADDTWRWSEPCRCKHCVKLGKVTINH